MPRTLALALLLIVGASAPALADGSVYAKYDALLKTYVNGQGLVDYAAFKKKDEQTLRKCVADMAKQDPKAMSADARKAYWINVYNAVTLKAMLEFYPLDSIKDKVSNIPGFYNVWDDYPFGPKKVSLNDIEHKLLRPMGDPRIHAAIVCASLGCPILRSEAYVPSKLGAQLDDNVRRWLKDTGRGLKVEANSVRVSKIFTWFEEDFGKDEATRLAWIAKYVDARSAKILRSSPSVSYLDWDWALNKQ